MNPPYYFILNPLNYLSHLPPLKEKLKNLQGNHVTYKKEIHRDSRFAICHYTLAFSQGRYTLTYDVQKSQKTTREKKTYSDPEILNCPSVVAILEQFLRDIGDVSLSRVEVKLIQTEAFPFIFNPHRDTQFWRLRHMKYLATVLVSCEGIEGGHMQLFHAQHDKVGPFTCIEELPALPGVGYVVDEVPQLIYHGMVPAFKVADSAHRAALLLRFY